MRRLFYFVMLMILSVQCYSAVTIDRTRLILVQNQPGEVVLRNNSEVVKIVSILVTDKNEVQRTDKILLTPNFIKMQPGESRVVRLFSLEKNLTEGRLYYLEIQEETDNIQLGLNVVLSSRIKIFVKTKPDKIDYKKSIKIGCSNTNKLWIKNLTNSFISVNNISSNDIIISDEYSLSKIEPKLISHFVLNENCPSGDELSVEFINEYGGLETYSMVMERGLQ
ncbi:molecular chaperone [Vibrio parahaemolyticus]|uniref:fimbrial biogenesis chaperone n=1 Tax=Vibrio parahaemolyticus TaxID=670 RepID=UPI002406AFBB|nr:fimbria/pilus periplasmic chaperone [Vibrio parahaemolyticus]